VASKLEELKAAASAYAYAAYAGADAAAAYATAYAEAIVAELKLLQEHKDDTD